MRNSSSCMNDGRRKKGCSYEGRQEITIGYSHLEPRGDDCNTTIKNASLLSFIYINFFLQKLTYKEI